MTSVIMGDVVFRFIFKYLLLVPLGALYSVRGMMFSGKYETSYGNTAYQNLVFFIFLVMILEKNKDHEKFSFLIQIILWGLVVRSFSGDDTLLSWPAICATMFGMTPEEYKRIASFCGLTFKYMEVKPLYGVVESRRYGMVWQTKNTIKGVTFLKNSMCRVFETNDSVREYVGLYPYRDCEDLLFRLGNSDKSNSTIDGFLAKVLSITYLSLGNRQAYTFCCLLYRLAISIFGVVTLDKEKVSKLLKSSYALYNLIQSAETMEFPTLKYLRDRHDQWVKKPKKGLFSGIIPDRSDSNVRSLIGGIRDDFNLDDMDSIT